jgi:UDP-glucose:(heptosyl)LPS alpha-1,3-glucosyltransferase
VKVALVILHADPARGGAERYTIDLAGALVRRGHEVSLLASSFGGAVEGVRSQLLDAGGATRARRYIRFLDSLDVHLASTDYDIVHAMLPVRRCDVYHPHAGLAAEALARGHLKHRGVIGQRLSQLANRINRRRQEFGAVERQLLGSQRPPVVLCLSDYVKETVRRNFPRLPEECLTKLFNATDLERFDPMKRPAAGEGVRQRFGFAADDVVGLMLAQDFQRKGLKESIIAVADVADPRLKLLVAGKQNPSGFRRLAQNTGIERQICFAGATDDPYAFYKAADFLILPTWHDPCSLVVLEAIAMGLPVISTAMNGACEIMTSGVHGFVIASPADRTGLVDALRKLLDSPRRREMSAACLSLRPALSYANHLQALEETYGRIRRYRSPGQQGL